MSAARSTTTGGGDCRRQLALLFAYLDGELTPARRRQIERHLDGCHCCADLAGSVRRAIAACQAAGRVRVPTRVHRRALAEVRKVLGRR